MFLKASFKDVCGSDGNSKGSCENFPFLFIRVKMVNAKDDSATYKTQNSWKHFLRFLRARQVENTFDWKKPIFCTFKPT